VAATFTLTQEQLQKANPATVLLLELCALLAPDELPLSLLLSEPGSLREPLTAAASDLLQRRNVVGLLYQSGLLIPNTDQTARMHRLVQAVTLARLPETDRHERTVEVVGLLHSLFPAQSWEPAEWPRCALLLTHVQAVLGHAGALQLTTPTLASLLTRVAVYLWSRGLDVRLARELQEQALTMFRRVHEGDHPEVAASLNNLALSLRELGEQERARELDEQALAMRQRLEDRRSAPGR
jgi:hypothetical protein